MRMKRNCMIGFILFLLLLWTIPVWGRAGGGGSSSSSGGSSSSSSHSGSHYYGNSSRHGRPGIGGYIVQIVLAGAVAGGGSLILIVKGKAARTKSRRAMAVYAQLGDNWDAQEIQRQVETAYFEIQECWRRMDASYASAFLTEELRKEFHSKLQWMQVRGEEVVQKNVRLLSAVPVCALDEPGEENDVLWYLIHGKMIGYYIKKETAEVVRGTSRPEAFFEYWKFVFRDGRWVLAQIKQKDEMDIDALSNLMPM